MMRPSYKVTEFLGDGIAAELSQAVRTLAEALPIRLEFEPVDLSLQNRRARGATIYDEAVVSIVANKVGIKTRRSPPRKAPTRFKEATRLVGHSSTGDDDSRRADEFSPRVGPRHCSDRHRRDL